LAQRQQTGAGGVLSFELAGGKTAAWALIDKVQLMSRTANLGDTRTTITHPATTSHGRLTPKARALAGITDGMVRISVGLEYVGDLIKDLQSGL
jgi:O-succinylhomoserine sulfhydrylase